MAEEDEDRIPGWVDVLSRGPIRIMSDATADDLVGEMIERLSALLHSHNGLEPTAEGWRQLALELALAHHPAFKIETPVDRESIGGRPAGFGTFTLRSRMKTEMRKGKSQADAARAVSKASKGKISFKTANNVFSRKARLPDTLSRLPYEWLADNAMKMAADKLSQE